MRAGGRDRFAQGTPRCRTVSTPDGGGPVNACVIAMDTAAVTLAALAPGLISAGRRGPFPGLAGSLAVPAGSSCGPAPSDLHAGHAAQPHPDPIPDRPRHETPRY